MISTRSPIPSAAIAASSTGSSARLPRGVQFGPKQRWTRYDGAASASSPGWSLRSSQTTHCLETYRYRADRRPGFNRLPDQGEIALGDDVDVALEGQRPVRGGPLRHVCHLAGDT